MAVAQSWSALLLRTASAPGKSQRFFVPQNDSFFDAVARAGILTFCRDGPDRLDCRGAIKTGRDCAIKTGKVSGEEGKSLAWHGQ